MIIAIRERPIIFSGPMVSAILDGRKTQTRRVVNKVGHLQCCWHWEHNSDYRNSRCGEMCPYGTVGDLLWVREEHYRYGHWEPVPGVKTKTGRMKWRFVANTDELRYDAPDEFRKGRHNADPGTSAWHKRLARFMPRVASRITLEITGVRVERVHDISEEDAMAEGVEASTTPGCGVDGKWCHGTCGRHGRCMYIGSHVEAFKTIWQSINGDESWESNPWVWAIEFRRVK